MLKIPQINKKTEMGIYSVLGKCHIGSIFEPTTNEVNALIETDLYCVSVNGRECPVRSCRESAIPFNRPWPGKQRDLSQTELSAFITFSADEDVLLKVKPKKSFDNALVRPLSKNVTLELENGEIVFTLKDTGSYVLELGSSHEVLHIFFNPVKEYPDAQSATHYFGPGLHFPGVINLRDNDIIYIDEEAIVFGAINSTGAKNVRIYGGGILDNSCEERVLEHGYENYTKGAFRIYNCHNITIEDIIILNSSMWVMSMFYCSNVTIDNIKIVGQWRYNTDGIDIVNTSHVIVKNSFIHSFDDTITIKGIYDYEGCLENIVVDNCVLWCGWGHTCELGIETHAKEYKNVWFKNCDLIHNQGPALAVPNGHSALIHDIHFENMNVEFQHDTLPMVMQTSDDMIYDGSEKKQSSVLISLTNHLWPGFFTTENGYKIERCQTVGKVCDIYFDNIRVYTDEDSIKPRIVIKSRDENVIFENISINNLYLNGEKQNDFNLFTTELENCKNIELDGKSIW